MPKCECGPDCNCGGNCECKDCDCKKEEKWVIDVGIPKLLILEKKMVE